MMDPRPGRDDLDDPRPGRRRWLAGCSILLVAVASVAGYQALTWPDVDRLATENPKTTAFFESARRQAPERGGSVEPIRWLPYDRISPHLKRAVLVGEDIDFFSHEGFATEEMKLAWGEFRRGGELRGASTITQQLAKNLWLSPSRNPWRKAKEALLTVQLEQRLSKRRILELYLNVVEFGPTTFGAENAARRYFGTSAGELSESEAAALATALPSPRRWHPESESPAAEERRRIVLRRMRAAQWLWKVI